MIVEDKNVKQLESKIVTYKYDIDEYSIELYEKANHKSYFYERRVYRFWYFKFIKNSFEVFSESWLREEEKRSIEFQYWKLYSNPYPINSKKWIEEERSRKMDLNRSINESYRSYITYLNIFEMYLNGLVNVGSQPFGLQWMQYNHFLELFKKKSFIIANAALANQLYERALQAKTKYRENEILKIYETKYTRFLGEKFFFKKEKTVVEEIMERYENKRKLKPKFIENAWGGKQWSEDQSSYLKMNKFKRWFLNIRFGMEAWYLSHSLFQTKIFNIKKIYNDVLSYAVDLSVIQRFVDFSIKFGFSEVLSLRIKKEIEVLESSDVSLDQEAILDHVLELQEKEEDLIKDFDEYEIQQIKKRRKTKLQNNKIIMDEWSERISYILYKMYYNNNNTNLGIGVLALVEEIKSAYINEFNDLLNELSFSSIEIYPFFIQKREILNEVFNNLMTKIIPFSKVGYLRVSLMEREVYENVIDFLKDDSSNIYSVDRDQLVVDIKNNINIFSSQEREYLISKISLMKEQGNRELILSYKNFLKNYFYSSMFLQMSSKIDKEKFVWNNFSFYKKYELSSRLFFLEYMRLRGKEYIFSGVEVTLSDLNFINRRMDTKISKYSVDLMAKVVYNKDGSFSFNETNTYFSRFSLLLKFLEHLNKLVKFWKLLDDKYKY